MSVPYAFKYIDKDNIVRDFTKIDDFVERVKNMDAKIEDLTKQISESNCSCDQERINNIDNRLQNVEETTAELKQSIGEDEGENDTNLNDVMSKLATHSSNIAGMKLDISSNKTTLNSVNNKVTTNTTDIAELKKQIAQLNANITAIMTTLNNKLDKTSTDLLTVTRLKSTGGTNGNYEYEGYDIMEYLKTVSTHTNDIAIVTGNLFDLISNAYSKINDKLDKTHASTLTVPTFNSSTFDLTGFYTDITNTDVDTYLNDVSKWIGAMMSALQGKY